jgi:predicted metal-binding membrane protein
MSRSRYRIADQRALLGICALAMLASTAVTVYFYRSMTGAMAMPGEWTMSMAWMKAPGHSWLFSYLSFLLMWVVMMAAMMLPSLVPNLLSFERRLAGPSRARAASMTGLLGASYLLVWAVVGAVLYPLGAALANAEMRSAALAQSAPLAAGCALLFAGWLQSSKWKVRQLERCRIAQDCSSAPCRRASDAVRQGLLLGVHCTLCCCSLMLALLVVGVMNLEAMLVIAAATTIERLAPKPLLYARLAGYLLIGAGGVAVTLALATALHPI